MVRAIGTLIGALFVASLAWAFWGEASGVISDPPKPTAAEEFHKEPKELSLPSDGIFGKYDNQQLQRGFQVFKEVCSACHSLNQVAFRDLEEIGYGEAEVDAIADQWVIEQPTVDSDTGEVTTRKNVASDRFPAPFANETAAKAANGGAVPPDLSLMAKAREGGAPYIYSVLTGYEKPDPELAKEFPDFKVLPGLHYNPYFPSLAIAMAKQLHDEGQVAYEDGTKPTVHQMAKDVSAFLVWTAEPKLNQRHAAGYASVGFLVIFCFLAWGAYQNIWRDVKH